MIAPQYIVDTQNRGTVYSQTASEKDIFLLLRSAMDGWLSDRVLRGRKFEAISKLHVNCARVCYGLYGTML